MQNTEHQFSEPDFLPEAALPLEGKKLKTFNEVLLKLVTDSDLGLDKRAESFHILSTLLTAPNGQAFKINTEQAEHIFRAYRVLINDYGRLDTIAPQDIGDVNTATVALRTIIEQNRKTFATRENAEALADILDTKSLPDKAARDVVASLYALIEAAHKTDQTHIITQQVVESLERLANETGAKGDRQAAVRNAAAALAHIKKYDLAAPAPHAPSGKNPDGPEARRYSHG